ncbi:uncharacterized protein [Halyomorpha halys]|uniref:uncharacterized protein n=1 Tax=Halyomorpha halys TaxID=286706 RepID=UPI0006D4CE1D|nr:uncharacterized protein LOC106690363 [Halyomorpha halys]XP_014291264.1 uncharacterized protein LOC106690363 [Halyomorpha halys]
MEQHKLNFIKLIIFLSLLQSGLLWTHYEKGYRGNNDDVCHFDESNNRVCRDLGEYAYRGQLVDGIPKPHAYFMNDAQLYEELKTYMENEIAIPIDSDLSLLD